MSEYGNPAVAQAFWRSVPPPLRPLLQGAAIFYIAMLCIDIGTMIVSHPRPDGGLQRGRGPDRNQVSGSCSARAAVDCRMGMCRSCHSFVYKGPPPPPICNNLKRKGKRKRKSTGYPIVYRTSFESAFLSFFVSSDKSSSLFFPSSIYINKHVLVRPRSVSSPPSL